MGTELAEVASSPIPLSSSRCSATLAIERGVCSFKDLGVCDIDILLDHVLGVRPHVKGQAFVIAMCYCDVASSKKPTQVTDVLDHDRFLTIQPRKHHARHYHRLTENHLRIPFEISIRRDCVRAWKSWDLPGTLIAPMSSSSCSSLRSQ